MAKEGEVGAIWEKEGKKGKWLSITINGVQYVGWHNDYKKAGEKTPDWRIFESKPREDIPF